MIRNRELYLDDNATTRVLSLAADEAPQRHGAPVREPSSSHITGLRARKILESGRAMARKVLGAESGRIVFTSGATEAIQMSVFSALCGIKEKRAMGQVAGGQRVLLYGASEHKAVPQSLHHWNRLLDIGDEVVAVPVGEDGQLDFEFLADHLDRADMLCTMAVNNETGVIHNLPQIEQFLGQAKAPVPWLVDCVQAVGKVQLKLANTSIDYATLSGHKIYAPKGIGLLYVRDGAALTPLLAGGGQEGGARGGTENLPGVAAIGAVLEELDRKHLGLFKGTDELVRYRDRLIASLQQAFPKIVFNTPFELSVPTTINFAVSGFSSKEVLDLFDAAGIRVSSGSACGSAIQGSYVLEAMGLPKWRSDGAVRLSFGPATEPMDIDAACLRIEEAGRALAESCLGAPTPTLPGRDIKLDGLVQLKMGSNCSWILADAKSQQAVVIDPFAELLDRIETLIRCQDFQVVAVLDTHRHVDHQSPREELVATFVDRMVDQGPTDILGWPTECATQVALGDASSAPSLSVGSMVLARTELPGHTVDGTAILAGTPRDGQMHPTDVRFAFTGDTLLIGGIGRTDFESSCARSMLLSLRKLDRILGATTIVCPTHDYSTGFVTTLASERQQNDFLGKILDPVQLLSEDAYLEEKRRVDSEIADETNCELVCGRIETSTCNASLDVEPEQLQEFFRSHRESLIIDVREPHEYHFEQDWDQLGFDQAPRNVPLTRFADFLSTLLPQWPETGGKDIIFLCRSGTRSSRAAQVVRRLGIDSVFHIAGGIALGTEPSRFELVSDDMEYII